MPTYFFDFSEHQGPYDWSQWHVGAMFTEILKTLPAAKNTAALAIKVLEFRP